MRPSLAATAAVAEEVEALRQGAARRRAAALRAGCWCQTLTSLATERCACVPVSACARVRATAWDGLGPCPPPQAELARPPTRAPQHRSQPHACTHARTLPPTLPPTHPPAQVLAVPLQRRPLFPGAIMPVTVQSNTLIKELVELRRQG